MNQTTISILRGLLCPGFYDRIFKILIIFLLILALSANRAAAQDKAPANAPIIGGTIPESIWNYSNKSFNPAATDKNRMSTLSLKQYRGKVIILDFWATWCTSCIKNFPEMDRLQKKFPDDIKIISVNNEVISKGTALLSKRYLEKGEHFVNIVGDSLLNQTFYHQSIPHYIWIGRDGKILASTGCEELDSLKVIEALHGRSTSFVNKIIIDAGQPLFTRDDFPIAKVSKFNLLIDGMVSGFPTGTRFRKDSVSGKVIGRAFTNRTISSIYLTIANMVKPEMEALSDKKIFYKGNHSKEFKDRLFNYEFDVPTFRSRQLYPLMLADLNLYSPYTATFEERDIECLILERTESQPKNFPIIEKESGSKLLKNVNGKSTIFSSEKFKVGYLIQFLNSSREIPYPVIDRTGIVQPIPLMVDTSKSLSKMNSQLGSFGLRLRKGTSKQEVLIVRDQAITD